MARRSTRATRQMTRQLDAALAAFRNAPPRPARGWVHAIREALGMTRTQFACRLGISRPNTYRLESDEVSGSASLARLRRAAAALDCELVYALVPKDSLEETVRRQAVRYAERNLAHVNASQSLEGSAISGGALSRQMEDLVAELMIDRPRSLWDD